MSRRSKERVQNERLDAEDLPGTYLLDYKDSLDPVPGGLPSCSRRLCPYHQLTESNLDDEPLVSSSSSSDQRFSRTGNSPKIIPPLFHVTDSSNTGSNQNEIGGSGSARARTALNPKRDISRHQRAVVSKEDSMSSSRGSCVDLIRDSNVYFAAVTQEPSSDDVIDPLTSTTKSALFCLSV